MLKVTHGFENPGPPDSSPKDTHQTPGTYTDTYTVPAPRQGQANTDRSRPFCPPLSGWAPPLSNLHPESLRVYVFSCTAQLSMPYSSLERGSIAQRKGCGTS